MPEQGDGPSDRREQARRRGGTGGGRAGSRPRSPRTIWSPSMITPTHVEDPTLLDAEIDAIVALLRERGPRGRQTIRRELETGLWGPGRLGQALTEARRRGRIRRIGMRTYEATDDDG